MTNYLDLSIVEIHDLLVKKKITPLDLVNESFARIEASDLNAFITLDKEGAISRCMELGEVEESNLLFGIPIAVKDNIVTKGIITTCGSKMLENFNPVYNASVIDFVLDNKMIIIGKTNMDEFAFGSTSETSYFGNSLNPWNKKLVPGGSSGGSAVSVAGSLVPFALASDTGGSIRQPSAFCGVVGIKPTYGRVSRYGLVAFASSLDQIGCMSRNVYENALLLNVIARKDDKDLTSVSTSEDFTSLIGDSVSGMKIAIPSFYISDLIDKEIISHMDEVRSLLDANNITIDIVDIPYIEHSVLLYQIIGMGEASSNLARFDGIKYGYSYPDYKTLDELYCKSRSLGFGDEVKRRIMVGSYILSGPNARIYLEKAMKLRNSLALEFDKLFNDYDLIIGPTTTTLPYEVGTFTDDPMKSFLDDVLTIPSNMAGLPSMSLPIGFSSNKLPIGMQIIGNKFDEKTIYKLASFIEKELGGK